VPQSSAPAPRKTRAAAHRASAAAPPPSLVSSTASKILGTSGVALPPGFVQHIVATTAPTSCTNSQRIVVSLSTGNAFPLACRSWLCDDCSSKKWLAARVLFERGILAAFARGERVRFLTLTDGSKHGTMTVHDLSQAWGKLATMLRRGGPPLPRPPKGSATWSSTAAPPPRSGVTGEFPKRRTTQSGPKYPSRDLSRSACLLDREL
jgi:hypothetical protein